MALVELIMPKMGESIIEATVLRWFKEVGDPIEEEETVLEVATDKVDSEVPSPVAGTLHEILFKENETVPVGQPLAIISTAAETPTTEEEENENHDAGIQEDIPFVPVPPKKEEIEDNAQRATRFYSPLVKSIAKEEGISMQTLEKIKGTGQDGRVTKDDIFDFLKQSKSSAATSVSQTQYSGNVEIIEMDRVRRLIAKHMVEAKQTAPHVSSVVEVDVTNMVHWREKHKDAFFKKYQTKITYTPIILQAIATAIGLFPNINCSVQEDKIILKKDINLGIATALKSGNLIVPVLKHADRYNLAGIAEKANGLINKARTNNLLPEDIQDGTFTFTNIGMFNNIIGTPIIPLPQAAILAAGVIKKRPMVLETEHGDVIAIRHMMYLSMSYDHRVIDGYLGGSFLNAIKQLLEDFDSNSPL